MSDNIRYKQCDLKKKGYSFSGNAKSACKEKPNMQTKGQVEKVSEDIIGHLNKNQDHPHLEQSISLNGDKIKCCTKSFILHENGDIIQF